MGPNLIKCALNAPHENGFSFRFQNLWGVLVSIFTYLVSILTLLVSISKREPVLVRCVKCALDEIRPHMTSYPHMCVYSTCKKPIICFHSIVFIRITRYNNIDHCDCLDFGFYITYRNLQITELASGGGGGWVQQLLCDTQYLHLQ